MGTAGPNPALNALLAPSAAAQGAAALGASRAVTSSQPPSQPEVQTRYSDSAARTAMIGRKHDPSPARLIELRARQFAQAEPETPAEGEVSHFLGSAALSAAMMIGNAGSDVFLGHSFEEWAARFMIAGLVFFIPYAVINGIEAVKGMHHKAKLISGLKEVDWIGEHASELVHHFHQWENRPERPYIDSVLDAVASMPIPPSQRWGVLKEFFIERSLAFRSPFYPYASAYWHAPILAGVSGSMKESGYSPEEVLEIARVLLLDESVEHYLRIDEFVKEHMTWALKAMKDAGFSAGDAASTLRAAEEAMAIPTSNGDDHVITNTIRTLTQSHGFTPEEVRSYLKKVVIPVQRELKQGREIWMHVPSYDQHASSILIDNTIQELLYSILAQEARHRSIPSIPQLIREMNAEGLRAVEQIEIVNNRLS